VAKAAAIVRMERDGKITTLREGKNGFSCMVIGGGEKMCADANSMEFFDAWAKHQPPPNKLGLTCMLSGYDVGGSNTDTTAPPTGSYKNSSDEVAHTAAICHPKSGPDPLVKK
jgi:hypothetical protein